MGCWMSGRRGSRGGRAGGRFAPREQRPGGKQGSRDADKFAEGPDGAVEMEPRDGPVVNSEMLQSSWGGVRMVGTRGLLKCGIWREDLELRRGFCGAGVFRSGEEGFGDSGGASGSFS
jgi:hypothetical protein